MDLLIKHKNKETLKENRAPRQFLPQKANS